MLIPNGLMYTLWTPPPQNVQLVSCKRLLPIIVFPNSSCQTTEFKKLLSDNGIKETLTFPYHPSSNYGLAEQAVQTFKHAVAMLEGPMEIPLFKFLFKYRVTYQTTTGLSPAQLLMRRRQRTHLDLIHPNTSPQTDVDKQQKADSTMKTPHTFTIGENSFGKDFYQSKWILVVVTRISGPRSYHVKTNKGVVLRRHMDHLQTR